MQCFVIAPASYLSVRLMIVNMNEYIGIASGLLSAYCLTFFEAIPTYAPTDIVLKSIQMLKALLSRIPREKFHSYLVVHVDCDLTIFTATCTWLKKVSEIRRSGSMMGGGRFILNSLCLLLKHGTCPQRLSQNIWLTSYILS
ncbi:hypothetical protein Plhal304r1_c047g0129171 [Plasmopara halstedii]